MPVTDDFEHTGNWLVERTPVRAKRVRNRPEVNLGESGRDHTRAIGKEEDRIRRWRRECSDEVPRNCRIDAVDKCALAGGRLRHHRALLALLDSYAQEQSGKDHYPEPLHGKTPLRPSAQTASASQITAPASPLTTCSNSSRQFSRFAASSPWLKSSRGDTHCSA